MTNLANAVPSGVEISDTRFLNCMEYGVRYSSGSHGTLRDCDFERCGIAGVMVEKAARPVVLDCVFLKNGETGIRVMTYGDPLIMRNQVKDQANNGIVVEKFGRGIFYDNAIFENGSVGAVVKDASTPLFLANDFASNKHGGIHTVEGARGNYMRNYIAGGHGSQVLIDSHAQPMFHENNIGFSLEDGVTVTNCGGGSLQRNIIKSNRKRGIVVELDGDPYVVGNVIEDNKDDGIHVSNNGMGTFIENTVKANFGCNVYVAAGGDPTLRGNTIQEGFEGGVCVVDEGNGTIEKNVIKDNSNANVVVGDAHTDPTVAANQISKSAGSGVFCYGESRGTFYRNYIHDNKKCGVQVASEADPTMKKNSIAREAVGILVWMMGYGTFQNNKIHDCFGSGLLIEQGGAPTSVEENEICDNSSTGVILGAYASGAIRRNIIEGNGICGVRCAGSTGHGLRFVAITAEEREKRQKILSSTESAAAAVAGGASTHRRKKAVLAEVDSYELVRQRKAEETAKKEAKHTAGGVTPTSTPPAVPLLPPLEDDAPEPILVIDNQIRNNVICGVMLETQCGGNFEENNIESNGPFGVLAEIDFYHSGLTQFLPKNSEQLRLAATNIGMNSGVEVSRVTGGGTTTFSKNKLVKHTEAGIHFANHPPDNRICFSETTITESPKYGIHLTGHSYCHLFDRTHISGCEEGIWCDDGARATFTRNVVKKCSHCGLHITRKAHPELEQGNEFSQCTTYGVLAEEGARGRLLDCRIHHNYFAGVGLFYLATSTGAAASTLFEDNIITENDYFGVYVCPQVPKGSGVGLKSRAAAMAHVTLEIPSADTAVTHDTALFSRFEGNMIRRSRLASVYVEQGYYLGSHDGKDETLSFSSPSPSRKARDYGGSSTGVTPEGKKDAFGALRSETPISTAAKNTLSEDEEERLVLWKMQTTVVFHRNKLMQSTFGVIVGPHCAPFFLSNRIAANDFAGGMIKASAHPLLQYNIVENNQCIGLLFSRFSRGIVKGNTIASNNPGGAGEGPPSFTNTNAPGAAVAAVSPGRSAVNEDETMYNAVLHRFYEDSVLEEQDKKEEEERQRVLQENPDAFQKPTGGGVGFTGGKKGSKSSPILAGYQTPPRLAPTHRVDPFDELPSNLQHKVTTYNHVINLFMSTIDLTSTLSMTQAATTNLGVTSAHVSAALSVEGGIGVWLEEGCEPDILENLIHSHDLNGVRLSNAASFGRMKSAVQGGTAGGGGGGTDFGATLTATSGGQFLTSILSPNFKGADTASPAGSPQSSFYRSPMKPISPGSGPTPSSSSAPSAATVSLLGGTPNVRGNEIYDNVDGIAMILRNPLLTLLGQEGGTEKNEGDGEETASGAFGRKPSQRGLKRGGAGSGVSLGIKMEELTSASIELEILQYHTIEADFDSTEIQGMSVVAKLEENQIRTNRQRGLVVEYDTPSDESGNSSGTATGSNRSRLVAQRQPLVVVRQNVFKANGLVAIEVEGKPAPALCRKEGAGAPSGSRTSAGGKNGGLSLNHQVSCNAKLWVDKNTFKDAKLGLWFHGSTDHLIIRRNLFTNHSEGIRIEGNGTACFIGPGNVFRENVTGISVQHNAPRIPSSFAVVREHTILFKNEFEANEKAGVSVEQNAIALLVGNRFASHPMAGIGLLFSGVQSKGVVIKNEFVENDGSSFLITNSAFDVRVERNHVCNNRVGGVISRSAGGLISNNYFTQNSRCGLRIAGPFTWPTVTKNVFESHVSSSVFASEDSDPFEGGSKEKDAGTGKRKSTAGVDNRVDYSTGPLGERSVTAAVLVGVGGGGTITDNYFLSNDIALHVSTEKGRLPSKTGGALQQYSATAAILSAETTSPLVPPSPMSGEDTEEDSQSPLSTSGVVNTSLAGASSSTGLLVPSLVTTVTTLLKIEQNYIARCVVHGVLLTSSEYVEQFDMNKSFSFGTEEHANSLLGGSFLGNSTTFSGGAVEATTSTYAAVKSVGTSALQLNSSMSGQPLPCYPVTILGNFLEENAVADLCLRDGGDALICKNTFIGRVVSGPSGYGYIADNVFLSHSISPSIALESEGLSVFAENIVRYSKVGVHCAARTRCEVRNCWISSTTIGIHSDPESYAQCEGNIITRSADCGIRALGSHFVGNEVCLCPVGCVINDPTEELAKQKAALTSPSGRSPTTTATDAKPLGITPTATASPGGGDGIVGAHFSGQNTIHDCEGDGVLVCGQCVFSRNVVYVCKNNVNVLYNQTHGMPKIEHNTIMDAAVTGLELGPNSRATVVENDCFDCGSCACAIESGARCVVDHNRFSSYQESGALVLADDANSTLNRNTIRNQYSPAYKKGLVHARQREQAKRIQSIRGTLSTQDTTLGEQMEQQRQVVTSMENLRKVVEDVELNYEELRKRGIKIDHAEVEELAEAGSQQAKTPTNESLQTTDQKAGRPRSFSTGRRGSDVGPTKRPSVGGPTAPMARRHTLTGRENAGRVGDLKQVAQQRRESVQKGSTSAAAAKKKSRESLPEDFGSNAAPGSIAEGLKKKPVAKQRAKLDQMSLLIHSVGTPGSTDPIARLLAAETYLSVVSTSAVDPVTQLLKTSSTHLTLIYIPSHVMIATSTIKDSDITALTSLDHTISIRKLCGLVIIPSECEAFLQEEAKKKLDASKVAKAPAKQPMTEGEADDGTTAPDSHSLLPAVWSSVLQHGYCCLDIGKLLGWTQDLTGKSRDALLRNPYDGVAAAEELKKQLGVKTFQKPIAKSATGTFGARRTSTSTTGRTLPARRQSTAVSLGEPSESGGKRPSSTSGSGKPHSPSSS